MGLGLVVCGLVREKRAYKKKIKSCILLIGSMYNINFNKEKEENVQTMLQTVLLRVSPLY